MAFFFTVLTCLMITVVTPARSHDLQTQGQTLCNSSNTDENLDCRSFSSCNRKSSYLVGIEKVGWFQAYVICKHAGMELASVSSLEEELALEAHTKTIENKGGPYEGYWLAGTRHGACGSDFVWLTTGKPVIYRKFGAGQPDNAGANEACLELVFYPPNAFDWNDIPCDVKLGYICQSSKCCS